jgi:hypothetical protein
MSAVADLRSSNFDILRARGAAVLRPYTAFVTRRVLPADRFDLAKNPNPRQDELHPTFVGMFVSAQTPRRLE